MENQESYYLVSLKWTHKDDPLITFWKGRVGYAWFRAWCGRFPSNEANKIQENGTAGPAPTVLAVATSKIDDLWVKSTYNEIDVEFMPNTQQVRDRMGITKADLVKKYPTADLRGAWYVE